MLWEVNIHPAASEQDETSARLVAEASHLGFARGPKIRAAQGYLLDSALSAGEIEHLAKTLLADSVVEEINVRPLNGAATPSAANADEAVVHVLPKPGVMDPVAQSALGAMHNLGLNVSAVRTMRKYWIGGLSSSDLKKFCEKLLANDAIEQVVIGPLHIDRLEVGAPYTFQLRHAPINSLDDDALTHLSRKAQLYLSLAEMQTIQRHFRDLGREPTDVELETLAQTWSEHCSHKTLAGRIDYQDETGKRRFENMLKETIFAATQQIRKELGADDWCVSVFKDNAGVIRFDDQNHLVFKVETHNHPSALEPYGGANTGLGGVIRDPLGTGMGAKPVCSTDVFCFAPPDIAASELPAGVLHPMRVMKGVVSGVRDYGNRMGIPTVNGAVFFDPRYLGNPLVYCGNVGILPVGKSEKQVQPNDLIVVIGGRTGRDGIHGATFSSVELTSESEMLSGGAVQIGNAITEKMVLDVVLAARDRNLFHAITDCGAGGLSSAVGEMGEEVGAEVWLEKAPLKYEGLSYTEIWISEAQERMVLAVGPDQWEALHALAESESVEATVIGKFVPTGRLRLLYNGEQVGDLDMHFLHGGRPPVIRQATYSPRKDSPLELVSDANSSFTTDLFKILGSLNVCSKEWVIRQYDHEVQGGSVLKPLVGVRNDGPGDAAVVRPVLTSRRALVVSNGMNPRYGDFDTRHMATSAIDEAVRNCVAVGADPDRIAILDNFCWGDCEKPETLGSLVRAAIACHDTAVAFGAPFISGKDSLNNEFRFTDDSGVRQTIAIPSSLLISALGQMDDAGLVVSMDFKAPGNAIYIVGETHNELGGSHFALVRNLDGGAVPKVDLQKAPEIFRVMHAAIKQRLIRACHDLSEGGLAAALAEMAFSGEIGCDVALDSMPGSAKSIASRLFSESNTRFLCEVAEADAAAFEKSLGKVPHARIGKTDSGKKLVIRGEASTPPVIESDLAELKNAWRKPLMWD